MAEIEHTDVTSGNRVYFGEAATAYQHGLADGATAERVRLYAMLGNDHYVFFTEDGWTTEHSIECRLSGHMHECDYHTMMAPFANEHGAEMPGRWRIVSVDADSDPVLKSANMPGGQQ
jgi:hypothetical protein